MSYLHGVLRYFERGWVEIIEGRKGKIGNYLSVQGQ